MFYRYFLARPGGATATGRSQNTAKVVAVIKPLSGGAIGASANSVKAIIRVEALTGATATARSGGTRLTLIAKTSGAVGSALGHASYQLVTYAVAGITRDSSGNAIGAVTCKLFTYTADVKQGTVTSNAITGAYSFSVTSAFQGWVSFYRTGTPDIKDRTPEPLTPVPTVIQAG